MDYRMLQFKHIHNSLHYLKVISVIAFTMFTLVTVTTDTVERWIEDEKAIICSAEKSISKFDCCKFIYCCHSYRQLEAKLFHNVT